MKIISWNVNGIRAVERKGELDVLIETEAPDILMLQETKASPDQLSKNLTEHPDYEQFYHSADKKGYSGTAIFSKIPPISVENDLKIIKHAQIPTLYLSLELSGFVMHRRNLQIVSGASKDTVMSKYSNVKGY